jgi:murein DD-endopeptidase MepM/ murein hydrolase activator NlpD
MTITFKFVTNVVADDDDPLGILNQTEDSNLMVGTDCSSPDTLNEPFNWHFRIEGVTEADVYPRQLDGPSETYGTWFNPGLTSDRDDDKCNQIQNWPMHVVQSSGPGNTYNWDIYLVPYLGGSYISGIEPLLPIPGTQYTLTLFQGTGSTPYDTIVSEPIPDLFPVFGEARGGKADADFYPALFGYQYLDSTPNGTHRGIDTVPLGLFASGTPDLDWDTNPANADYKTIYAVADGMVVLDVVEPGVTDIYLIADEEGPYAGLEFAYIHVVPTVSNFSEVSAGDPIATILNYEIDERAGDRTHLHFEARVRGTSPIKKKDPRKFIYPVLTPNP